MNGRWIVSPDEVLEVDNHVCSPPIQSVKRMIGRTMVDQPTLPAGVIWECPCSIRYILRAGQWEKDYSTYTIDELTDTGLQNG